MHWGSPASRLAEIVLTGHPDESGKSRVWVDEVGRRRILAWIDLNVPYYGTSESNHYDLTGCRQIVPADLDHVFDQVFARRCESCHDGQSEKLRDTFVRITNVEHNRFLLAPLARAAGGTERCGQPIFASREDPDYKAILRTFESVGELLEKQPRMDMVESADSVAGSYPPGAD
jgi:hypothetical protein